MPRDAPYRVKLPQDKGKAVVSGRIAYDDDVMLKQTKTNPHRAAAAFLSLALVAGVPFQVQSAKINSKLVEHKAFYEMQMGERLQSSHIVNINGMSAFAIERDCTGWRSIEDYMIQFVAESGGSDRVLSHFESWEADSGDKYSFDIMEESSFEGRKDFGGFVEISSGEDGNAYFTLEPDTAIKLPSDTVFPMQHVRNILDHAEAGNKIIGATVFTGAEPDSALMRTSTVVGGWRDEPATGLGELAEDGYWQITVAYFKPLSTSAEPEYEIQFSMQANGLVREYEINYGDFSIMANLKSVEPVEPVSCS